MIEKFKEWIISVKLERNFTKEEILGPLSEYGNLSVIIYLAFGMHPEHFFKKNPTGLLLKKQRYSLVWLRAVPYSTPAETLRLPLDRRNTGDGPNGSQWYIPDEKEAEKLKLKPIQLKYQKMDENAGIAPYFREVLRDEVKKWCRENKNPKTGNPYDIYKDGLKIFTTINPKMQEYAEIAVYRHMQNLQKVFSNQKNIKDGSIWKTKDGKAIILAFHETIGEMENMAKKMA